MFTLPLVVSWYLFGTFFLGREPLSMHVVVVRSWQGSCLFGRQGLGWGVGACSQATEEVTCKDERRGRCGYGLIMDAQDDGFWGRLLRATISEKEMA
jgi:hypothetical protein